MVLITVKTFVGIVCLKSKMIRVSQIELDVNENVVYVNIYNGKISAFFKIYFRIMYILINSHFCGSV